MVFYLSGGKICIENRNALVTSSLVFTVLRYTFDSLVPCMRGNGAPRPGSFTLRRAAMVQPRLRRFREMALDHFVDWFRQYDKKDVLNADRFQSTNIRKIVYVGSGCSALGPFYLQCLAENGDLDLDISITTEYELSKQVWKQRLDENTLAVIGSVSGVTTTALKSYQSVKQVTDNIVFFTAGGDLQRIAETDGIPAILINRDEFDPEYNFFAMGRMCQAFIHGMHDLGVLDSDYREKFSEIQDLGELARKEAARVATLLRDKTVVLSSTGGWLPLLNAVFQHFTCLAMVPAHLEEFHALAHIGITPFSNQVCKSGGILLLDKTDDSYTEEQMTKFVDIISEHTDSRAVVVELKGQTLTERYHYGFQFLWEIVYELGLHYDVPNMDLISKLSGNPHWTEPKIREVGS